MVENPYAAPTALVEAAPTAVTGDASELEAIRKAHINAEGNIKAVGFLSYAGGALVLLRLPEMIAHTPRTMPVAGRIGDAFGIGLMIVVAFYAGWLLRRLQPQGRWVQAAAAVLATLTAPLLIIWTVIILYMLWSAKARVVFTEHYRTVVVPATPHIKYRMSAFVWSAFGLLTLLAVFLSSVKH